MQAQLSASVPQVLSSPERTKKYIKELERATTANARQGNLELVMGSIQFPTTAGGVIAANTQLRMFQDGFGGFAAGGLALTHADATFFQGKVPSGQLLILRGMGMGVYCREGAASAQDVEMLCRTCSVTVNLRSTPVPAGNIAMWPTETGARGTGNGNVTDGTRPFDPGIVLQPNQDFTIDFEVVRAVTLSQQSANYVVQALLPAIRVYDPLVLARS